MERWLEEARRSYIYLSHAREGGGVQVIAVSPLRSTISGTWLDGSGLDHASDIVVKTF